MIEKKILNEFFNVSLLSLGNGNDWLMIIFNDIFIKFLNSRREYIIVVKILYLRV